MDDSLTPLKGKTYDVVVIGGGINGTSAAQLLAADGYSVLLVDKGDFGSGASGRSARMLHPGLRYFEAENPLRHFGLHPGRFFRALKGARQMMGSVSEHLKDGGDRIWPYRMCFPVYEGDTFKAWHVKAGIRLLQLLGDGTVPFDFEMIRQQSADRLPFYKDFRDPDRLSAVACYNEFKFDWPERFCVDMALDAERNGAILRTYCSAKLGDRSPDGTWAIHLATAREAATVQGRRVLNLAGTWTDDVLPEGSKSVVTMTKGVHLIVALPDAYRGHGVASLNRLGLPYYITPMFGNAFSIGVTETPFEGDASDVRAEEDDIDFLLAETNHILPGLGLTRRDVLRTWAGVRPLTHSEAEGGGTRDRKLHDLAENGLPGVFALTSGPIITHRATGRLLRDKIRTGLAPSGSKGHVDYTPFAFTRGDNSPPFAPDAPDIRISDLQHGAKKEHGKTLADVLERRTDLLWRRNLTQTEISRAAKIIGEELGWSETQAAEEAQAFANYQDQQFSTAKPPERNAAE